MKPFETLFGIKSKYVKKNCILLPLLSKGILDEFRVKDFSRGKLYGLGNADSFSLIHTGMGAGFVGDAVLYLKESPCRNIILFGSCGLVDVKDNLSIGGLVSPYKCYAHESFTDMLLRSKAEPKAFYAHRALFESLLEANLKRDLKKVVCSTISSLKLEEGMLDSFTKEGVDIIDMECSAFFAASNYVGFKAIALFYINDIIKKKPFYTSLEPVLKFRLSSSIKNAANLLCKFINENLRV